MKSGQNCESYQIIIIIVNVPVWCPVKMVDQFLIKLIPGCKIENAMDYYGNDILFKKVDTLQACASLCSSTPGGLFWTWSLKHEGDKNCWVKTSDSGRVHNPLTVSGNRECGEYLVFQLLFMPYYLLASSGAMLYSEQCHSGMA